MNNQMKTKLEKLREDAEIASVVHKTTRKFADASQKFLDAVYLYGVAAHDARNSSDFDPSGRYRYGSLRWLASDIADVQRAAIVCCDKAHSLAWDSFAKETLACDTYEDELSKKSNDD